MIRQLLIPSSDTDVWQAADDALSLSQQVGTDVYLLFNDVLLHVKHQRDSVADVFSAYERKAPLLRR